VRTSVLCTKDFSLVFLLVSAVIPLYWIPLNLTLKTMAQQVLWIIILSY